MGQHPTPGQDQRPDAVGLTLRGVQLVTLGSDDVVLKRGVSEVRLGLPGLSSVLDRIGALADGTRNEEDLVAVFEPDDQPQIRRLVSALRSRGLLRPDGPDDPADAFWQTMAPFASEPIALLAAATVLVVGEGAIADATAAALIASGVGAVTRSAEAPGLVGPAAEPEPPATIWCVASESPSARSTLLAAATAALRSAVVLLPVWLEDLVIRVGPMTHPFDTACLQCLLLRLDANDPKRDLHRRLRAEAGDGVAGAGHLPPMTSVAGHVAAMEIVKQLAGLPVSCVGHVIELGLVPYRSDVRRVLRVPRCPLCSGIADRGAPVVAHVSQLAE